MKQIYTGSILLLALLLFPFMTYSQKSKDKEQAPHLGKFEEGKITLKLKEGLSDYDTQTGMVYFGISSLDENVQRFGVYRLEKQFRVNKRLAKAGMPDLSRIYKLSFSGDYPLRELIQAFSADPNVEYAEGIPIQTVSIIPNDSLYDDCQHLPQIMAEEAWDIHKGEDGEEEVVIAIVDTGTEWTHEDLTDNVWQNLAEDADGDSVTIEFIDGEWVLDPDDLDGIDNDNNGYTDDLIGWDFYEEENGDNGSDPDPSPSTNSHGTHCAGIAAASTNNGLGVAGLSYNVTYMPIMTGGIGAQSNSILYGYEGIVYAAEMGADIISCSWGGSGFSNAEQEVINYAKSLGSIVVVAAGNSGIDQLRYPSSYLNSLSVANVFESDVINPGSTYNLAVDIAAPGTGILSPIIGNDYDSWTGTSMSCPIIAGSLGLLKSFHPDWSNEELITCMIATADNIDDMNAGYEYLVGSGRVNAYEMLLCDSLEDPYLKLGLTALNPIDENENGLLEAGESVIIDMDIRNFMQTYGVDGANLTLTSSSPYISMMDGDGSMDIGADSIMSIIQQFEFQISTDAEVHLAEFNLHVDADLPIVVGEDLPFSLLIAPSGYLVYDGVEDGADFSGEYIYDYLLENNLPALYTVENEFPESLIGFEAVFLCMGNYDSGNREFNGEMPEIVTTYLENGGDVYMEGGDPLGWDQEGNTDLYAYFGVESTSDGSTNPINSLMGQEDAITAGMLFTDNTQASNSYIDTYVPTADGIVAFIEENYGDVAVQYDAGSYQTFVFSYAIAKLIDGDSISTKDALLQEILYFFDISTAVNEDLSIDPFSCSVYPNPTNAGTTIRYQLPSNAEISIEIMNSKGQIVASKIEEFQAQGQHVFYWNAEEMPAGVYYYTLRSTSHKSTGKIILMR